MDYAPLPLAESDEHTFCHRTLTLYACGFYIHYECFHLCLGLVAEYMQASQIRHLQKPDCDCR
ncbi:hypothetical protein HMPREF9449_03049 [Odoribacter laneus YIT 12061]|uniref:Uncharacterized protein n=1 Tax=Odoribacter laneus YIT 12061 TaxID=742817 RepID=H1DLB3_9BACT|nr:hypothetical protein HMPREF9449_03049 [Odoribacter laneus YIT 12061]